MLLHSHARFGSCIVKRVVLAYEEVLCILGGAFILLHSCMHFDVACFQGECICLGGAFRLCLLIALVICLGGACDLVCALCSITCV